MKLTSKTLKEMIESEINLTISEGWKDRLGAQVTGIAGPLFGNNYEEQVFAQMILASSNMVKKFAKDLESDAEKLGLDPESVLVSKLYHIADQIKEKFNSQMSQSSALFVKEGISDRISSRIAGVAGSITGSYEQSKAEDFRKKAIQRIAKLANEIKEDEKEMNLPDNFLFHKQILALARELIGTPLKK